MRPDARTRRRTDARAVARVAAALAVPLCVCASVRPAQAQNNPAIKAAVALAAGGNGDSARRLVAAELTKAKPGDPAYVEALYWSGRLAASGDSAESDLRRVAIEYSNSPWADEALLQLAQLAMAAGNGAGALQLAERLRNDYPSSPLRSRAALWAGRAAFEVGDPVTACALLDSARTEAPDDVEFLNQVGFYHGRCAVVESLQRADTARARPAPAPAPADTTHVSPPAARPATSPPAAAAPTPSAPSPAPGFEVQVRATRSNRTARDMVSRIARAGLHAHIEKGEDGILRVRAGPFTGEREATLAAERLRRLLGGHPFVLSPS
jgi:cell division septation protein DedD